ncbi:hypothetical protein F8388_026987 [Cannabis sativa]|uniref:Uncharacterized protein n=1 Tax=Cannabis sativa TaxID=3483 RepID=A0A7J6EDH7_CANSA|nr:hypothetical protein F8388_026987 [Cannabis sativa]
MTTLTSLFEKLQPLRWCVTCPTTKVILSLKESKTSFGYVMDYLSKCEDVNESGGEESAPDLPLVPRACSQLRKPCPTAVEGEENAQASPSVPNIGGRMRRPSIVVPIIRPDDATIQMLESVHDNIDLLVRKTETVEVVRECPTTKVILSLKESKTSFGSRRNSALSDAKHERDKDELKEILGRRLTELNNAQTRLEERKTQVNYYIDQNFDLAKKNTALEKALDTVTKEHDSAVKALRTPFRNLRKGQRKTTKDKELMKCKARLLREATLPSTTDIPGGSTSMDPPEDTLP